MWIEIEIPEEFKVDYTKDKFADFLARVKADIDYNGMCGNYERETANVFTEAFKNSRVVQTVDYKGERLIDADAVVEQLEDKIDGIGFIRDTPEANAYIKGINDAIKVVKGGGTQ